MGLLNGQSNLLVLSLPVASQVKDNVQAEHGYTVFTAMKALTGFTNKCAGIHQTLSTQWVAGIH